MNKLFLLFALLCAPCFATISGTMQWDVRTTGSDTNGGGFDSAPGTGQDFSQQDAAQTAYTDLVIGSTTTQATSAAHPFSSCSAGAGPCNNLVNVISGTGCTVQRAQILSVSAGVATFDKSLGTAASTCTGNLGGAVATPDAMASANTSTVGDQGWQVHIKTGTYTRTTTLNLAGKSSMQFIGYQTTHFDGGTKPLITTATNSTPLVFTGGTYYFVFSNLSFSNTATTRSYGFKSNTGGSYNYTALYNCVLDGFSWGVIADNSLASAGYVYLVDSEIKNGTLGGASAWFSMVSWNSYIHDNAGPGLQKTSNQNDGVFDVIHSIVARNTKGIDGEGSAYLRVLNSDIVSNTGDGIYLLSTNLVTVRDSIIYGNGGYGFNSAAGLLPVSIPLNQRNAYGANTSGDTHNVTKSAADITLTADPFTSKSTGDFSLNPTAGALCKAASYPSPFPGGTANSRDVGAVQSGVTASAFACGFSKNLAPAWAQ